MLSESRAGHTETASDGIPPHRYDGADSTRKRKKTRTEKYGPLSGVADGARTHDNRNHNPGLYQLSYSHHKNGFQSNSWHARQESNL